MMDAATVLEGRVQVVASHVLGHKLDPNMLMSIDELLSADLEKVCNACM